MVKCKDCGQEMQTATSCTLPYIKVNGEVYKRNTRYHDINKRCHDCGIVNGNIHHFGCDIERCPRCKQQIISCSCRKGARLFTGATFHSSRSSKLRNKIRTKRILRRKPAIGSAEWVARETSF